MTDRVSARALVSLGEPEALQLAATMPVGRIAYVQDDQPYVIPVNFLLDGRDALLRTTNDSELAVAAARGAPVVLEVDDLVTWSSSGWSVLIRGRLTEVLDPARVQEVLSGDLRSWAGGERERVLRVIGDQVTGRRIQPGPGGVTVVHF